MSIFKKAYLKATVAFCSGMLAVTAASAQNIGEELLDSSADSMIELVSSLVRVLQVALGLGALVTLVMVIFNLFKGERESAQKIGWWVMGLALGFALISVVAARIESV